ncbi:hypothetical protein ABT224_20060 [Streptomyces sp. NPDC001584]|uniref:hypothetical protein n=1 Tax=Streptomyces sp. NPDC001584 TaxID=3154521 RepID=UPI00331A559C
MPVRQWPGREEWQERAEYAARTLCPPRDRLPADAVFSTATEDAEALALIRDAATRARPAVTAAIAVLRGRLPDRPAAGRGRIAWFLNLDDAAEVVASELAQLESSRTRLARALRTGHQGEALEELRHIANCPAVEVPAEVASALVRLAELAALATARCDQAAEEALQKAIAAEVARRRTDQAWGRELERRSRVEAGPVVVRIRA